MRKFLTGLMFLAVISVLYTSVLAVDSNEIFSSNEEMIYNYAKSINDEDTDQYILLFTEENQENMMDFVNSYGKNDFFLEESVDINRITRLSEDTGIQSASLSVEELEKFEDIQVYYVEMCVDKADISNKVFVLAEEEGFWKIYRVSVPDFKTIIDDSEGFNNIPEQQQLQIQEFEKEQVAKSVTRTPNADPTEITVYFKKSANQTYHGAVRDTIDFEVYLKNVIPNEWVVSYYQNYPAYLQAGTMASKMYAWWYIIHPKWNFSPYYADVLDDSSDQNYLYSSYEDMGSNVYKGYADAALDFVRNIALCDNDGNMFELHYHATAGSQYSGQLSASGAYELAKQGYNMLQILQYYYNYSSYIGTNHTVMLFGYV